MLFLNSKSFAITTIIIRIIALIAIIIGMTYFAYKSLLEDGITSYPHLFMLLVPIFIVYVIYEFIQKKISTKNSDFVKLQLLSRENYHHGTSYNLIYLDTPYNYISEITEWIDIETVGKNLIINIDCTIFESIFDKFLNQFPHYDCYEITDFYEENASKLCTLLENEKKLINNISKNDFEKKYKSIFNSIRDKGDFKIKYDIQKEFDMVFSDINIIIDTFIMYLQQSINEKKSVTIIGI